MEKKYTYLFHKKSNDIKKVELDNAIVEIYYLAYRIPTKDELKTYKINKTVEEIKREISENDSHMPLYDVFTSNIYIVQKRNVYIRVVMHDYRFPDELIIDNIVKTRDRKLKKVQNNPELAKDLVYMRTIRKTELMIDFMNQLDHQTLYNTYLSIFYRYAPELGNATYTCLRKSFIPHKSHLSPYYSKDEIIKLGMNMGIIVIPKDTSYVDYKDSLTKNDYQEICKKIQENDIAAETLVLHQNYIVENNMVGLVQYYTAKGSYDINMYLRGLTRYEYKNEYLENNIEKMWNLVLNAPAFDNNYILYRFVGNDDFLKHLEVGDIFMDKGFTSTTRDPFYRTDLYKFGFVLIKIRIPKNIKGVGLCLETLSHFPNEEEIILPPLAKLKLISKNDKCEYYHPNETFVGNVDKRYEFEWIGNSEMKITGRTEIYKDTKTIDFLKLDKIRTVTIKEKTDILLSKYFDPMNRIKCKIGDNTYYVIAEHYDSSGIYSKLYSIKTSDGFSLYTMYDNYTLFIIEIGEVDGLRAMKVNYHTKYSRLNRQEILGDDNFIMFLSGIANYYDIPNIVIYADYISCDKLKKKDLQKIQLSRENFFKLHRPIMKNISGGNNIVSCVDVLADSKSSDADRKKCMDINKEFDGDLYYIPSMNKKQRNFLGKQNDERDIREETDIDVDITYTGGSYCVDFYKYLKYNTKRYENTTTTNSELQPVFSYYDLDLLKSVSPLSILIKEDRDEIYQIYVKNYKLNPENKDNIADFYIWMIDNKCYLMDIFVQKINRLYRYENPFKKGYYILDAAAYLYNRGLVKTYNRYIKITNDENHQILTLPSNEYSIRR